MTDMDIIKDMNSIYSQFKQGLMFFLGYLTSLEISYAYVSSLGKSL